MIRLVPLGRLSLREIAERKGIPLGTAKSPPTTASEPRLILNRSRSSRHRLPHARHVASRLRPRGARPAEMEEVRRHLKMCPQCAREAKLAGLPALLDQIDPADVPPPTLARAGGGRAQPLRARPQRAATDSLRDGGAPPCLRPPPASPRRSCSAWSSCSPTTPTTAPTRPPTCVPPRATAGPAATPGSPPSMRHARAPAKRLSGSRRRRLYEVWCVRPDRTLG